MVGEGGEKQAEPYGATGLEVHGVTLWRVRY